MGTRDELAALVDAAATPPGRGRSSTGRCRSSEARDGFAAMAAGDVFGKVVLTR